MRLIAALLAALLTACASARARRHGALHRLDRRREGRHQQAHHRRAAWNPDPVEFQQDALPSGWHGSSSCPRRLQHFAAVWPPAAIRHGASGFARLLHPRGPRRAICPTPRAGRRRLRAEFFCPMPLAPQRVPARPRRPRAKPCSTPTAPPQDPCRPRRPDQPAHRRARIAWRRSRHCLEAAPASATSATPPIVSAPSRICGDPAVQHQHGEHEREHRRHHRAWCATRTCTSRT